MKKLVLSTVILLTGLGSMYGQTTTFNWKEAADGSLEDASKWTPDGFTPAGANLNFAIAGDYRVELGVAMSANAVMLRGGSGTVTLDFGTRKLTLGNLFQVNQNAHLQSGQVEGTLQVGTAASGKVFTISGIGTEFTTANNVAIGRNNDTNSANNNSLILSGGALFETTGAFFVGENARDGATANGNSVTVTGANTTLRANSLLVGSLAGNSAASASVGNSFTLTNGATATVGALTVGRRAPSVTNDASRDNTITVGGGSILTATGVVSIGSIGGGNTITVESGGTVNATGAATRVSDGEGNALIINGGSYIATTQKITTYGSSHVSISSNGNLTGTTMELQSVMNLSDTATVNLSRLMLVETSVINITIGSATEYARITASSVNGQEFAGRFNLTFDEGFQAVAGAEFQIFNFSTSTGEFAAVDLPSLAAGLQWDTSDLYRTGTIAVIPEASVTAMTVTALIMLVAFSVKRRAAQL